MRELLSHKYECANPKDYKDFVNSCKGKDWKGNNVFHEIFMLEEEMRNKYLAVIYDPAYQVKAYLRPQPKKRCCGWLAASNQVVEIAAAIILSIIESQAPISWKETLSILTP